MHSPQRLPRFPSFHFLFTPACFATCVYLFYCFERLKIFECVLLFCSLWSTILFYMSKFKTESSQGENFLSFLFFFLIVSMKRWMLAELMWSSFHTMYKWNHNAVPSSFYGDVNYFSIKLEKIEIETRNFLMNISKQGHYVTGTGTSVASPRLGPPPFFQAQGFPSSL